MVHLNGKFACHGITWATGVPTLLLADVTTRTLVHEPVTGRTLGFKVTALGRFCTGRYTFIDRYYVQPEPCPGQAEATAGDQCGYCAAKDEFRSAHRVHVGGPVPAAVHAYMTQPHWLYLATFADATSKIGTAADSRKTSRLNEQGPLLATYLARLPDGLAVRRIEDALSIELGVPQTTRSIAKLRALLTPQRGRSEVAHHQLTVRAITALAASGVQPLTEAWTPPAEGRALEHLEPGGQRDAYPHDLRAGEHGLAVDACLGTNVLLRPSNGNDATIRYVTDLQRLKGTRLTFGSYASPTGQTQTRLF